MKISKGLKQAYDLQDFTYEAALALRASLLEKSLRQGTQKGKMYVSREDAAAIGSLVKAWESCQERIRIHRNKPMPGVLRPEGKKRGKASRTPQTLAEGISQQSTLSETQLACDGDSASPLEESTVVRPSPVTSGAERQASQ